MNRLRSTLFLILVIACFSKTKAQTIDHWESLVLASNTWKWIEPTGTIASWETSGFNDVSWSSGPGGMGYADGDDGTTIPATISVYMRRTFTVVDTSLIEYAVFNADYDDGFVAYLNGVEIARSFMGLGGSATTWNQAADGNHEAALYTGGSPDYFTLDKATLLSMLVNGTNVLAIEVHNVDAFSSDLTGNFYLNVGVSTSTVTYSPVPSWFVEPMVFTDSDLPIIVLDTRGQTILDDPRIVIDMGIIYNGPGVRNYMSDPFNEYNGEINIELRGSSSAGFPKQSYSLETQDTNDVALDVSIFGMPSENDWVLYPPYTDKSLLQNFMTYELGRAQGHWAPRCRYVELVVNGDYRGIYIFMEKIKRDGDRVDIAKLTPTDISGDDVTGGYILKIDKFTGGGDAFTSNFESYAGAWQDIYFQYHDPKLSEMVVQQTNYIQSYVDDFETALNGPTFSDAVTGYPNYIEPISFIDYFIMDEVARNVDGYRLSTFFYKAKDSDGGKLHMGPLWDFNIAWGNADYCNGGLQTGWAYQFNSVCGGDSYQIPFWWEKLLTDTTFTNQLKCRWEFLRNHSLNTDTLMNMIDSLVLMLDESQVRNYQRWPILGTYVWPNNYVGATYADEVAYFKFWLTGRLTWLDANMPGNCTATGIAEQTQTSFFTFPNPATDVMYVRGDVSQTNMPVLIRDVSGKIVYSSPFAVGMSLDVHSLAAGVYYVSLGGSTRKIVISR
ncbi:MAG TPA: CotH kinase family protein [Flavobacteriales bacterium]|nr:CotH kinase family protein [Flavobacteriales bacterium]